MFGARYFGARFFGARYFGKAGASSVTKTINRVDTSPVESDIGGFKSTIGINPPGVPLTPPDSSVFAKGGTSKPITASDSLPATSDITNLGRIAPPHYVQFWSYQTAAATTETSSSITLGTGGSAGVAPTLGNLLIMFVGTATGGFNLEITPSAGWTQPINGELVDTNSGYENQDIYVHTVTTSDPDLSPTLTYSPFGCTAQIWVVEVSGAGSVDVITQSLAIPASTPWASSTGTGISRGMNDVGIVFVSIADAIMLPDTLSGYTLLSSMGNHGDGFDSYGNTSAVFVSNAPLTTSSVVSQNVGWSSLAGGNEATMGQQILLFPSIVQISVTDTLPSETDTAKTKESRRVAVTDTATTITETAVGGSISHHDLGPIPIETAAQFADSGILYNTKGAIRPVDTTRITEAATFATTHVVSVSETDLETQTATFIRVKPFLASDTATAITDLARFRDTAIRVTDTATTVSEQVGIIQPKHAIAGDTAVRISDMPSIGVVPYVGPQLTPNTGAQRNYRIEIYNLAGNLIHIPQDIIAGWFEDAVNGGNTQGYFRMARPFEDVSWITYECRVKFYMHDSVDPWWDGRVIEFDQEQVENYDAEYIDLQLEGWKTRLAYAITSDSLNPGVQSNGQDNGTMNADTWLRALLGGNATYGMPGYLDTSTFAALDAGTICPDGSIPVILNKIQYDGTGLDEAINTVISQVLDNTGNSYEWWVRGSATGKPAIVIQPNQNPNIVSTGYQSPSASGPCTFLFDWKDSTTNAYSIQNNAQNIYNMIVLFGGTDPSTQQQIWGSFQDSTSISLYGARQKKVTNSLLLSTTTLSNYATAYLLQNGYPQPQGTYRKFIPTDAARAGKWIQIFMPSYINGNQVIQQVRATKVRVDFGSAVPESLMQTISVAAPRPYIDIAYYQAIAQTQNAAAVAATIPGPSVLNYYVVNGFNWVGTTAVTPPASCVVAITPPAGLFVTSSGNKLVQMSAGGNADGSIVVTLTDSVTAAGGDGTYYVMFAYDPLTTFGVGSHTPGLIVAKTTAFGAPPYNSEVLNGWQFTVMGGKVVGDRDLRVSGGIQTSNFAHLPSGSAYSAPTYTGTPTLAATSGLSGLSGGINVSNITITNVPQDGLVAYIAFFYRNSTSGNTNPWSYWGQIPIPGLPLPAASVVVGEIFNDLTAGTYFDFACAFVGIGGDINTATGISTCVSNYQATVLGIQVGYMLQINGNSQGYSPLVIVQSGPTPAGNQGGVSSNVTVDWVLENQPTDGSASKVAYWTRNYDGNAANPPYGYAGAWSKYSDAAINGLGTTPLPSSAPYNVTFNDVTNGNAWEFGVTVEDAQGNDAPYTLNGRGQVTPNPISFGVLSAQALSVGSLPMPAIIKTNGVSVNFAATSLGTQYTAATTGTAVQRFTLQVNTSDYGGAFGNVAPDWLNSMVVLTRSSTTGVLTGTQVPLAPDPQGTYANSIAIPSNAVVDIGCLYQDQTGAQCAQVIWFAFNVKSSALSLDSTQSGVTFYANVAGTNSAANVISNGTMYSGSPDANHGNIPGTGVVGDIHGWLYNWVVYANSPQRQWAWENYLGGVQPTLLLRLAPNSIIHAGEHSFNEIVCFESYQVNTGDILYVNTSIGIAASVGTLPAGCQSVAYSFVYITYADGTSTALYNNSLSGPNASSVDVGTSFTIGVNAAGSAPKSYQVYLQADFFNGSGADIQLGNQLYQDARFWNILVNRASSLQAEVFGQLNLGSNSSVVAGQNGSAIGSTGGLAGVGFAAGSHGTAGGGVDAFVPIQVGLALPANSAGGGTYVITVTYSAYGFSGIVYIGCGGAVNQGGFGLPITALTPGDTTLVGLATAPGGSTINAFALISPATDQFGTVQNFVADGVLQIQAVRTS